MEGKFNPCGNPIPKISWSFGKLGNKGNNDQQEKELMKIFLRENGQGKEMEGNTQFLPLVPPLGTNFEGPNPKVIKALE